MSGKKATRITPSAFNTAAAEMLGAAQVYQPEGMMQVGQDLSQLGPALQMIADAMKTMVQRSTDQDPIHPAILDTMGQVYGALQGAASTAEQLGPAFRSLHAVDIQRIENPRRNEAKWDVTANRH